MIRALLLFTLSFGFSIVFGQPRIDNIQSLSGTVEISPLSDVMITGEGFSNTKTDLEVWFGSVEGTIVRSTTTSIVVTVPPSARVSFVEVVHKPSRTSARSREKLVPSFSGVTFTPTFEQLRIENINSDQIWDLCSCDFDGDGKPDIVGSKQADNNLMLLRNTSSAALNSVGSTLNFTQTTITTTETYSVNCADLNGDGKPELVATRAGATGNMVYIFPNNSPDPPTAPAIVFGAAVTLLLPDFQKAKEIAISDLNRDGKPDIVVTNEQTNSIYIFENKLTSTSIVAAQFVRYDRPVLGIVTGGSQAVEIGDVTGDGWPDILVAPNKDGTTVFILVNAADGTIKFNGNSGFTGASNITDVAVADFNRDGRLDYVVSDRTGNRAIAYINVPPTGPELFKFTSIQLTAPVAFGVDVADMNGDGYTDIVVTSRKLAAPEVMSVYINNQSSAGGFLPVQSFTTTYASINVKAMDFDGDSRPDIAVTSTNNVNEFSIDIWKNKNCHKPTFITQSPMTLCNPQDTVIVAIGLQGVTYSYTAPTGPSAGATRSNVTIADAGTNAISLTATGEGGCSPPAASFTIINGGGMQPAVPNINAPTGVCAGNFIDLSTDVVASSYEWSGPDGFTSTVKDPPAILNVTTENAGTYKLRIKQGGCYSDYEDAQVVVAPKAEFEITTVGDMGSVCVGETLTLNASSTGGTTNYHFQWMKNGANIGTDASSYVIGPASESDQDNYTVFAYRNDIVCNNTSTAFPVTVFSKPVPVIEGIPVLVCIGTAISFDGSGTTPDPDPATPDMTFNWDYDDSNTDSGPTPSAHTYAIAATFDVKLTVSYEGMADCAVELMESVTVNPAIAPTITVEPNVTEICGDGSEVVVLYVNGVYSSYAWTPSAPNLDSLVATGPGTYAVVTTAANGCTGNAQFTLTPKPGCETATAGIPKVFTPNGDTFNDLWIISGVPQIDECSMSIFDGRGRRILEVKGFPITGWDGVANGKPVPDGTYYYVLGCPGSKPRTGSVLIVR